MSEKLSLCRPGPTFLPVGVKATSSDLELLRQKRALELRKRMLLSQKRDEPQRKQEQVDPHKVVAKVLAGRAAEVLETARRYYPAEISELEGRLAQAILSGGLRGPITGEELYSFLRRIGMDFSLDITIRVREGGKLKSLEEKLRSRD